MNLSPLSTEFNAEGYKAAATQHVVVAKHLYDAGHYVLSNYIAGLSVECMLRAYRLRLSGQFDARHDLRELLRQAGFSELIPEKQHAEYLSYFLVVARQWANNHR